MQRLKQSIHVSATAQSRFGKNYKAALRSSGRRSSRKLRIARRRSKQAIIDVGLSAHVLAGGIGVGILGSWVFIASGKKQEIIRVRQMAHTILDNWKVLPRLMMLAVTVLTYQAVHWFMSLDDPSVAQSGLVSVCMGALTGCFGIWMGKEQAK